MELMFEGPESCEQYSREVQETVMASGRRSIGCK